MKDKNPTTDFSYKCDTCKLYTNNKKDFSRHLNTKKHKNMVSNTNLANNSIIQNKKKNKQIKFYNCDKCNTTFNVYIQYWRHNKKCVVEKNNTYISYNNSELRDMFMVMFCHTELYNFISFILQDFENDCIKYKNNMDEYLNGESYKMLKNRLSLHMQLIKNNINKSTTFLNSKVSKY